LDIMMPRLDGYQVLEELRRVREPRHLSVLMLTARASADDVVRALDLGANDYLRKPFEVEEMLARVRTLVGLKRARQTLEENQERLDYELRLARTIQESLAPSRDQIRRQGQEAGLNLAARSVSASEVNGDLYEVSACRAGLCLYLFDCKGHGISAGMTSMTVRTLVRALPADGSSAAERLAALEPWLRASLPAREFVAAAGLVYRPSDSSLTVAISGLPDPFIIQAADGRAIRLGAAGRPPLGLAPEGAGFAEAAVRLKRGDKVVVFSDGLTEARNHRGDFFGVPDVKLMALLQEWSGLGCQEFADRLAGAWRDFQHGPPEDDCTILVLEKLPD
jgi:sigma-B regulation protein RsbU (phosphoserine phosphatase)